MIRMVLCAAMLALAACATQPVSVQCAQERAACKNSCKERLKTCNQVCDNGCNECSLDAKCATARNYSRYIHEQNIQGGIIARELNSYRDPLQCRKTTCNCLADFNVCTQSCTGLIHKRLQVGPACC